MKRFYLLALAATLAFTGCKKDDGDPRPENLTIEKTEYALDAVEERTATVAFTAAADWTLSVVYDDAESSADWLTVTPASGTAGEQTVELSAACNTHTASRTAFVDVVCGEQQVRLTVTQAAADALELIIEQTEYALDAVEERTATVAFTAAADWTLSVVYDDAESSADWLSVTPMSGTAGEQTVELSAARNFRASDRTAYADLVCGEQSVRLTVTQTAASEVVDFTAQFDPGFAQKLQELGIITDAEHITSADMEKIAAMTELDVSGTYENPGTLTSLQGIGYFESLTYLDCDYNKLTSLDMRANTALTFLKCDSNQLTSLDVRANTALTELSCHKNQLTTLDVSANTALTDLYCSDNSLTKLDVRQNTELMNLSCHSNQLTTLDVRANTALTELSCSFNSLTSLDVSRNTALTYLDCIYNQLTSLDVSANTELTAIGVSNNSLTELDVSQNTALTMLYCPSNSLTSLDVRANTALTYLYCGGNQLTTLDVSANTALTYLWCGSNQLTSLDVRANTALTYLHCSSNQLTSLDVRANTALTELSCHKNQLTSLDVRANTALTELWCFSNQLTSLDISRNTVLTELSCSYNPGDGESTFPVTAWFDTKPENLTVSQTSWTYGGKAITIDFRKAE